MDLVRAFRSEGDILRNSSVHLLSKDELEYTKEVQEDGDMVGFNVEKKGSCSSIQSAESGTYAVVCLVLGLMMMVLFGWTGEAAILLAGVALLVLCGAMIGIFLEDLKAPEPEEEDLRLLPEIKNIDFKFKEYEELATDLDDRTLEEFILEIDKVQHPERYSEEAVDWEEDDQELIY